MSELTISAPSQPSHEIVQAKNGRSLRITRRVRAAIDAMVWQGLKRDEAAQHAGMKDNSLYVALSRPDVKAYYLGQCEVLRVSGRARRLHRLDEIAEQSTNMNAAVAAIKAAELVEDTHGLGANAQRAPGVTVIVMQRADDTRAQNAVQVIDNTECEV